MSVERRQVVLFCSDAVVGSSVKLSELNFRSFQKIRIMRTAAEIVARSWVRYERTLKAVFAIFSGWGGEVVGWE